MRQQIENELGKKRGSTGSIYTYFFQKEEESIIDSTPLIKNYKVLLLFIKLDIDTEKDTHNATFLGTDILILKRNRYVKLLVAVETKPPGKKERKKETFD